MQKAHAHPQRKKIKINALKWCPEDGIEPPTRGFSIPKFWIEDRSVGSEFSVKPTTGNQSLSGRLSNHLGTRKGAVGGWCGCTSRPVKRLDLPPLASRRAPFRSLAHELEDRQSLRRPHLRQRRAQADHHVPRRQASDDGSGIWCSKGTIQRHTELGESTVKRTITDFLARGILIETGRRPCKNGFTVIYRIMLDRVMAFESSAEPDEGTWSTVKTRPARPR